MPRSTSDSLEFYLTSAQAAKLLDFSEDHIRNLISRGKIKAEKFGRNWMIHRDQLKKVSRQRFPRTKDNDDNGSHK